MKWYPPLPSERQNLRKKKKKTATTSKLSLFFFYFVTFLFLDGHSVLCFSLFSVSFFFHRGFHFCPQVAFFLVSLALEGKREMMKSFNDFLLPQERKLKEKSEGKNKGRERGREGEYEWREKEKGGLQDGERKIMRRREWEYKEKFGRVKGCLDKPNIQLI